MISGLFALATIMLFLVFAVVILLSALFPFMGANLAKIGQGGMTTDRRIACL